MTSLPARSIVIDMGKWHFQKPSQPNCELGWQRGKTGGFHPPVHRQGLAGGEAEGGGGWLGLWERNRGLETSSANAAEARNVSPCRSRFQNRGSFPFSEILKCAPQIAGRFLWGGILFRDGGEAVLDGDAGICREGIPVGEAPPLRWAVQTSRAGWHHICQSAARVGLHPMVKDFRIG